MRAMGFVTDYLNSPRMAQDLSKVMDSKRAKDLYYVNMLMTTALLRWRQFFENPFVDRNRLHMKEATATDFRQYCNDILYMINKRDISEDRLNPFIQNTIKDTAKKLFVYKHHFNERFVVLMAMAACEYHGFNAVFTERIRKYGLNPNTKFYSAKQITTIEQILDKAGQTMGNAHRDQKMVFTTPDPNVASRHARMSPEWFYFFTMGSSMVNEAYLNRDYNKARNQLLKFEGNEYLDMDDRVKIIKFFEQWWAKFATPQNPKVAVMPMFRDPASLNEQIEMNLEYLAKWGKKKAMKDLFKSGMYTGYQIKHTDAIPPKFIEIIDIPTPAILSQRLRNLRNVFQRTHLKLEKQFDNVLDNCQTTRAM